MMFFGFVGKAYDKEADVSLNPESPKTMLNEYTFELKKLLERDTSNKSKYA